MTTVLRLLICFSLAIVLIAPTTPAWAVNPDEVLEDPVLEQRARDISAMLRCLQCQNQSIDDSDAGFSKDMRLLVRERLVAGDTDEQVLDFVVARYGEFALLKPRFSTQNLILWVGPSVLLLIAIAGIVWRVRSGRRRTISTDRLTADEAAVLDEILNEHNDRNRH